MSSENILLKEKPYIRVHDTENPNITSRLKLSEESYERFKVFLNDKENVKGIKVKIQSDMWECENCGKRVVTEKGWNDSRVRDMMMLEENGCCENMQYEKCDRERYSLEANSR